MEQAIYAPLAGFVVYLAEVWPAWKEPYFGGGWRLPFVVEPMMGSHGRDSILLTRPG